MNKKIFYWAPYLGNVATIKAVINSAIILKKFKKNFTVSIVDCYQEWSKFENILNNNYVNLIYLQKKITINTNISGFIRSRLIYLYTFFLSYKKLKQLLQHEKPDFLIVHLLTYIPLLCFFFNNFSTKLFLRISGRPKFTFLRYIFWKIINNRVDVVFCPTIETLEYLKSKKIFNDEKIFFLPDPIIDIKNINLLKKKELDKKYSIKKDFFISIGRLTEQKNHLFLIDCFRQYADKFDLFILGNGELKEKIITKIKEYNLCNSIYVFNFDSNIYPLLLKSKALIMTSKWEDPGFVMIESASVNTIVISSDCPSGPKEFIDKEKCGYIFQSGNKQSFIKAMNRFLKDDHIAIYVKKYFAKKKSREYTKLNHFKILNKFIN